MSSGRRTSVARPAQYTPVGWSTPTAASASANASAVADGHVEPGAAQHAGERDGDAVRLDARSSSPASRAPTAARTSSPMPCVAHALWSSRYLSTVPSVASTVRSSSVVAPSAASACAQSIVSATPGGL